MTKGNAAIFLAGPTASGKSALALMLARAFKGTVINADSMQVYADLTVITARPSVAEEQAEPHRLYGIWPASQAGSVGKWRDAALAAIAECERAGRLPIVTGGTGLYFRALMEGLAVIPEISASAREEAEGMFERLGGEAFRHELARHDPKLAGRLLPNDRQRLTRGMEVWLATGRSLSEWQGDGDSGAYQGRVFSLLLDPPRADLYAAINERVERMVAQGALDEVASLLRLHLAPNLPAMKAVGVRELAEVLAGRAELGEAKAAMAQASRRYAKRQLTWFRKRFPSNLLLQKSLWTKDSEHFEVEIFPLIREFLLTGG